MMSMSNQNNYLALDCEHGGFIEGRPLTLLEAWLGIYNEDWQLQDALHLEVQPEDGMFMVQGEALAINKIDLIEHSRNAMTFKEAKPLVYDFIKQWSNDGANKLIPVGHNVEGDINLVRDFCISRGAWCNHVSYRTLDSGIIAQFFRAAGILPHNIRGALGELCKFYNIKLDNAHTAAADAHASAMLVKHFLSMMPRT